MHLNNPDLFRSQAFIGGEWRSAISGRTLDVEDPATGRVIGHVPDCDGEDTKLAIEAASSASHVWRATTAAERAGILERWHYLVLESIEDLGRILTAEQGKPLAEAQGEIRYAASFIKWFAEEGKRVSSQSMPAPERDRIIWTMLEPVGVSAAITPWNFPAAMITRKCAPALAAGCPIIVKPSEFTPFTALALAVLAERAGVPKGVFSVVTGFPKDIGAEITSNPIVRKLSFTGSTKVGSLLIRQSADTVKRLSMELGGNAPLLVFDDADLDLAVSSAIVSKFRNSGQTCVCANRIIVQSSVYDRFTELLVDAVRKMKVGIGTDAANNIGPLINDAAVRKVNEHVEDALLHGAKLAGAADCAMDESRYVAPMVLTDVTPAMRLASEETFGPIAPIFRFEDEQEGVALANSTPYGLASYFYTENLHRAFRVARRLEAGMVAVNTGSIAMEMAPFGGVKQSGLGREGGREGIEEYLEKKAVHFGNLKE